MAGTIPFLAAVAVILFFAWRTGQVRAMRLAVDPRNTSWSDVVPAGVPAPAPSGSLTGVIASGTRVAAAKERLWVVFDEEHLMATRFGSLGRDEPLIVDKDRASPVTVAGAGWRQRVSFGGGVVALTAPRTTTGPLVTRLQERGWAVLDPDGAPIGGWYPDPWDPRHLRLWSGTEWTPQVRNRL